MPATPDRIIEDIQIARAAGATTMEQYNALKMPDRVLASTFQIVSKYTSWNNAVRAAGFIPNNGRPLGSANGNDRGYHGAQADELIFDETPKCTAHLWTVENADGGQIYCDHLYPSRQFLAKIAAGWSIVRVDYECAVS